MVDSEIDSEDITDGIMPPLEPPPTVVRQFRPAPWHRPRKQYIRKYQWNHEIVEQIINKILNKNSESTIRVLGLPSSEYLDLLSMREVCNKYQKLVLYLGFNASYVSSAGPVPVSQKRLPVDLYAELQAQRMIESSSFVHPGSILYPDRFELIRNRQSQSRLILEQFRHFDVVNLDICGCIVDPNKNRATDVLEAVSELLRWQSTHRLDPWLLFVTTYSSPADINREGCRDLVDAVKANASASSEFRSEFTREAGVDPDDFHSAFITPGAELAGLESFISVFAVALGKWLAKQLQKPMPPSFVSMLPSYCFRHIEEDRPAGQEASQEPELLSLAYLVEPAPDPGLPGISIESSIGVDSTTRYNKHAKQILKKAFGMRDLDQLMLEDVAKRAEMVRETQALLVGCGFDSAEVIAFLSKHLKEVASDTAFGS